MSRRRVPARLLHFLVLGALLLVGKRMTAPAAGPPPLVVEGAASADAAAIHRAIVDAVLIDEALRAEWPLADPVVQERRGEAIAAGAGDDADLLPRLAATDPVTRARLAWIGRELVRAQVTPRLPDDHELAGYLAAHPQRYAPGWLTFHQRAISRARHGEATEADAAALAAQLDGAGLDAAGGDPTLLPARVAGTFATIDGRFGAGFAARVAAAPLERWSAPIAGGFGWHVVWREAGEPPPEQVDLRVARDWAHDQRERDLLDAIEARIRQRRVVVRRVPR